MIRKALLLPLVVLAQAGTTWVAPTVAFSLLVIAIVMVLIGIVVTIVASRAIKGSHTVAREVSELRTELRPTLDSLREVAKAGRGLTNRVEDEVGEIIRTSQRVRAEVDRGVRRAKRRLSEFDAVTEVVQEEIEETALDLAAAMRTARKGRGVIGRIRRVLRGRR